MIEAVSCRSLPPVQTPQARLRYTGADVEQGTSSRSKKTPRREKPVRRPSLLVRVLIGLLVVLAVGGVSFLIGYLIGLQLGLLPLL